MPYLLIASCILAVVSDMSFVWWAKNSSHSLPFLIVGFVLLNLATSVWVYSLRTGTESAIAITFYALTTVAGCSYLGVVVFKETLSTINWIGMGLALIALVLVSMPSHQP